MCHQPRNFDEPAAILLGLLQQELHIFEAWRSGQVSQIDIAKRRLPSALKHYLSRLCCMVEMCPGSMRG
jgi:hypothetical protein